MAGRKVLCLVVTKDDKTVGEKVALMAVKRVESTAELKAAE